LFNRLCVHRKSWVHWIKFRPLRRSVKKNGEKFREETGTFKRSAFARFRNFPSFFSFGDAAGGLSLWFRFSFGRAKEK
jgi:hypothetical protein